jgi:hypothetical protein
MTTVVTGFHPAGYELYGKRFLETFGEHWPDEVNLVCYTEEPIFAAIGNRSWLPLDALACSGLKSFIQRNAGDPVKCGRQQTSAWRPKEIARGYSYRFDAVKFCKQLFYPEDAASLIPDGEILAWFDADVVTLKDVPAGFIESMLGDADVCHLGRAPSHSEIGFWAVRLGPATRGFLSALAAMFRSDTVFRLREWHSAFVFDYCLSGLENASVKNLTPGGKGHVWFQSPLGRYTDHLKGDRKRLGKSPERG